MDLQVRSKKYEFNKFSCTFRKDEEPTYASSAEDAYQDAESLAPFYNDIQEFMDAHLETQIGRSAQKTHRWTLDKLQLQLQQPSRESDGTDYKAHLAVRSRNLSG